MTPRRQLPARLPLAIPVVALAACLYLIDRRRHVREAALRQELGRLQAALDAASQARARTLGHVAHQLRTPLGGVLGFAELLRKERFGPLNDRQREFIDNILAAARQLLALIDDGSGASSQAPHEPRKTKKSGH